MDSFFGDSGGDFGGVVGSGSVPAAAASADLGGSGGGGGGGGGAEDFLSGMDSNPYAEASMDAPVSTESGGAGGLGGGAAVAAAAAEDLFGATMEEYAPSGVSGEMKEEAAADDPKDEDDEEPTFLSIWQEQRRQTLEDRGRAEAEAQQKLIDDSKEWIKNYNEERQKKIELAKEEHRGKEQSIRDEFNTVFEHGSIWEQVARMVNLSESPVRKGATKEDTERFRQLLIVLKSMKATGSSASASS